MYQMSVHIFPTRIKSLSTYFRGNKYVTQITVRYMAPCDFIIFAVPCDAEQTQEKVLLAIRDRQNADRICARSCFFGNDNRNVTTVSATLDPIERASRTQIGHDSAPGNKKR